ncbi:ferric reductase-like transmembrane domain-containing protein [Aliiruegeria sabulilitoris]|uniref:ferric reductase-like transmembrane domain-containing protein n=1 Tax=Aliiruegeria sabulilitoris TaxID=1510458 RepID=UPI00082C3EA4|nr:ferric reductase-like transmembrane domain-containing protein [Aliiruegeria sabulilitoris]NDR58683.1 ferric reductase [Pseudoruegeria sp. M32A2M]
MRRVRSMLIWCALATAIAVPIALAAASPLIAWRDPVYIAGGFAGVIAMGLILLQPLLAGGYLPGISTLGRRRMHRWIGALLVAGVLVHVAALWITSPPDVLDALLFASPTPFSAWGVIAMWAIFATALLAALRRRLRLLWRKWRLAHTIFATVTVIGSVVHALLIEGTMETVSKTVLCVLVIAVTTKAFADLQVWSTRTKGGS